MLFDIDQQLGLLCQASQQTRFDCCLHPLKSSEIDEYEAIPYLVYIQQIIRIFGHRSNVIHCS